MSSLLPPSDCDLRSTSLFLACSLRSTSAACGPPALAFALPRSSTLGGGPVGLGGCVFALAQGGGAFRDGGFIRGSAWGFGISLSMN